MSKKVRSEKLLNMDLTKIVKNFWCANKASKVQVLKILFTRKIY